MNCVAYLGPTYVLFLMLLSTGCREQAATPVAPLRNTQTSVVSTTAPTKSNDSEVPPRLRHEDEEPAQQTKELKPIPLPEKLEENLDGEAKEAPEKDPPLPEGAKLLFPDQSKVLYVENLQGGKRRIHLLTEVCLRRGQLEALLCKAVTKEHEALLRAEIDGRLIHAALLLTGANPGSPAKFWDPKTDMPDYKPATGSPIRLTLTYHKSGKLRTDPAQYWIRDFKTSKQLNVDWVFAGSRLVTPPDEPDAKPFYTANNGDFISVANFPDSMLDLPVKSSKDNEERSYEAITDRIPPQGTKVLLTFELIAEAK